MQLNAIVMALAGAERIFNLLDEEPEVDNGYVTLVNAKEENGKLVPTDERTGHWAWKHTHQADGTTDYVEVQGNVVFNDVDFGYTDDKIVLHNIKLIGILKLLLNVRKLARPPSVSPPIPFNASTPPTIAHTT